MKEMASHSSILAWEIPWREEPWRVVLRGVHGLSKRLRHGLVTKEQHNNTWCGNVRCKVISFDVWQQWY